MFNSVPSLEPILQCLQPVFTQPSFQTHVAVLLGWVMCLGKRTEYGVFQTIQADTPAFPEGATSVRPLLQLLQSIGLDGPRPGPPGGRGDRRPAQSARPVVPGRRRHLAAQTGQACLRFGLVPRCGGLDGQTGRDRQRQPLGGGGIGDLHSRNQQDLLSADPRHAASCGQEPQERSHVGQGNAPGHPGMVPRSKAGFHRRRGLFGEQPARRSRPAGDLRRRDACRCGHLRSDRAEAIQEQAWTEAEEGPSSSQSQGGRQEGRRQPQWTGTVDLANGQSHRPTA